MIRLLESIESANQLVIELNNISQKLDDLESILADYSEFSEPLSNTISKLSEIYVIVKSLTSYDLSSVVLSSAVTELLLEFSNLLSLSSSIDDIDTRFLASDIIRSIINLLSSMQSTTV